MADYQLSYTGAEINNKLGLVSNLDNRLKSLEKWKHVDITAADCNSTYITQARGYYECWGTFCYVYVTLHIGATPFPANTIIALTNADVFPPPEYNVIDNTTLVTTGQEGYASLSVNRNVYPYMRYTGALYISAQSAFTGTNSNLFISGWYPIAEDYFN